MQRGLNTGPHQAAPPGLSVRAVVANVCGPEDRRFAVTYPKNPPDDSALTERTSITFSLSEWRGDADPTHGQIVQLDDISLFERGWRAKSAQPITARKKQ